MPRKSQFESLADEQAAPGGTAAVDRALSLLGVFQEGEAALALQDLAERTRLHKSTALRLLASLQHAGLVLRLPDGRYRLGPSVARLHAVYASSFSLEHVVMPALRALVEQTGESAAFHVMQGQQRLCLYRVDSPHPIRDHMRVGDLMPLDRGAGGHVLRAFSGVSAGGTMGKLYEKIRKDGVLVMSGDRVPQLSGVSAPVFDAQGQLVGAVTLNMPTERLREKYAQPVKQTAVDISGLLGFTPP